MKTHKRRIFLPSLALAAITLTGCPLLTAQIIVSVVLGSLNSTDVTIDGYYVDLSVESSDYRDHKDKLKDIPDLAVLGTIRNNLASPIGGEVWLVRNPAGSTLLVDKAAVVAAGGIKVWSLALGANETRTIDWDTSAGLFTAAGKAALVDEIKGDGIFTLYAVGSAAPFDLTVSNGAVVVVIAAEP